MTASRPMGTTRGKSKANRPWEPNERGKSPTSQCGRKWQPVGLWAQQEVKGKQMSHETLRKVVKAQRVNKAKNDSQRAYKHIRGKSKVNGLCEPKGRSKAQ